MLTVPCTCIPEQLTNPGVYQSKLSQLAKAPGCWKQRQQTDLYDPFEPTYMQLALERAGNLTHLILGNAARMKKSEIPGDPITRWFQSKGQPARSCDVDVRFMPF